MLIRKSKKPNGRRQIYVCGMKIFSYKRSPKRLEMTNPYTQKMQWGTVYFPYYHPVVMPSNKEPKIFNKNGKPLRTFFLRDFHMSADPTQQSKYFIWDKFNVGLDIHFYSHQAMLETMGNPKHKFGFFIETPSIVPEDYKIFQENPGLSKNFKYIFTNSKSILESVPNARFAPMNCSLFSGSFSSADCYKNKTKMCSILSSDKRMCPLHEYRFNLAHRCKKENLCDTYGTFDGGKIINIDKTLRDYRYSFCIENIQSPYLFTERLICAFANQCIPIYLGATDIGKFFNTKGIITLTMQDDITEVLKKCTKEEYEKRIPFILDNYERAKHFINPWDYIYEKYLSEII